MAGMKSWSNKLWHNSFLGSQLDSEMQSSFFGYFVDQNCRFGIDNSSIARDTEARVFCGDLELDRFVGEELFDRRLGAELINGLSDGLLIFRYLGFSLRRGLKIVPAQLAGLTTISICGQ